MMFRHSLRTALVAVGVLFLSSPSLLAQSDPTELARGLREHGHADLALEYLEDLSKKNLPPEVVAVLPLERARTRLELAGEENEEGKRDQLVNRARAELEQFLNVSGSTHPRRAEGQIALARLYSIQAKGVVSRANRLDDAEQRKAELKRARPIFQDSAKRYKGAAEALAKLADAPGLTPTQKRAAVTDIYQADLDQGINLFALADTFGSDSNTKEVLERGKYIDEAKAIFEALSKKDQRHPLCWVAMAWMSECEREKTNPKEAEKIITTIIRAARQYPAARAGLRQASFFDMRATVFANPPQPPRVVQQKVEEWLRRNPVSKGRPTGEQFAARYYLGLVKYNQAATVMAKVQPPKPKDPNAPPPPLTVPDAIKPMLKSAERDFRQLTFMENDYTSRASEKQSQIRRWLVGNADKPPAKIHDFDEALMTANVLLYNMLKNPPENRTTAANRVAAMFERVQQLPTSPDDAREVLEARVTLIYVYLLANRPMEAAILGDYLAHTARYAAPAARSGMYAAQAYLVTASKVPMGQTAFRTVDQSRAAQVVELLGQRFPTDPSTDTARLMMGRTLFGERKYMDAFEMLASVSNASPQIYAARLFQGAAAIELLKPNALDPTTKPISPTEKGKIFVKALADLEGVPTLPASAPADDAKLAVLVELQITELQILSGVSGYPKAERSADRALAEATKFTTLGEEDKLELQLKSRFAKLRAIYGQALPMFQKGKYAEAMVKIQPALDDLNKNGPAAKPADPKKELPPDIRNAAEKYDNFMRDQIIVLALQTRIGEGAVDKADILFKLLEKLGGSTDTIAQALGQLAISVGPRIDQLRKEGKAEEADKLIAGVGKLLDQVAAKKDVSQVAFYNLGKAMKDIGSYDRAVGLLTRVSDPGLELLSKPVAKLNDKERLPVLLYRGAQIELARAYRLSKQFNEADTVLKAAMGTPDKKGWGYTAPDFRKEATYLLEDKAENTAVPTEALPLWKQALTNWGQMAGEFLSIMRRPTPKDDAAKAELERLKARVKPMYHEIFYESTRCTLRANASLLKGNPDQLKEKFAKSAEQMVSLENANPDMINEIKAKFSGLLETYPDLKQKYIENQGKMFLPEATASIGS